MTIKTQCFLKSLKHDFAIWVNPVIAVVLICLSALFIVYVCPILVGGIFAGLTIFSAYNLFILIMCIIIIGTHYLIITDKDKTRIRGGDQYWGFALIDCIAIAFIWIAYVVASWVMSVTYPSVLFISILTFVILEITIPFTLAYARCKSGEEEPVIVEEKKE